MSLALVKNDEMETPAGTAPAPAPSRAAPEELHFTTHDGENLFYRHWPALGAKPRGAVLLFHRGHEHSGRMAHLVDELDMPDFAFFAWDARGHGRSPGKRGWSPSIGASVRDMQCLADHVARAHGVAVADMAVVAQSVGAVLAAAWVHDYAPPIRALVLASPAFQVKLYVPFARLLIALRQKFLGPFFVNSYVRAGALTHDPERVASFNADPLIARPIASHILLGLYGLAERVAADARAITVPTQVLISGSDWVVHQAPQHEFFNNLGSATKERHMLPGFRHDTLGEFGRTVPIARIRRFLAERFAETSPTPALLDADRTGFTRDEADRLATPPAPFSLSALRWRLARFGLRLGGRFSPGIELGFRTGFDSGSTLDYVYRNEARGGVLGRVIDRAYLDSIGWRGIRQRKRHVEELFALASRRLSDAGQPLRVLDIAAGHGRYVLDAVAALPAPPQSVTLRDWSPLNVEAGTKLIAERGLADVARFEQADAFDRKAIAGVEPKPTLGLVSGLYELFPDNGPVRRSLTGLAEAIPAGGFLILTCQPWHPQLEFIARALSSHRGGQAWIMRRRTQGEMDALAAAAGFAKREQRIDEWGIFTVALYERTAA